MVDITDKLKAETALREQSALRDQLAQIAATVPGVIYSFRMRPDGSTSLPFSTQEIYDILGVRSEEVREDFSPVLPLIHPEDVPRMWSCIAESARTMQPYRLAVRVRHPARGEVWVEGHAIPSAEPDGSILWNGHMHDVTELKESEMALAKEASYRRTLIEVSRDGIVILDEEARAIEVNQRFAAMLGYSNEEILKLHVWDWDPDWPKARALEAIRNLGPEGICIETRHRRKDGSFIDVEMSNSVTEFDGKKRVLCVCHDITHRKQTEAALRENLLFLREAEKIARIGAWKANPATDHLYLSEGAREILGLPPESNPGLEAGFAYCDSESVPLLRSALDASLRDGTPFALEIGITPRSGEHRWADLRGLGRVEEGGVSFAIGTFQDITERRELESQLRQSQKLEAVGQLAGGVAHDFNTILAAMMLHLGLLQMKQGIDERVLRSLKEIETEARRAETLTRQLLMFSRRSVLDIKPLDLNDVIANLLRMLTRLIGENIQLRFESGSGLPPAAADAAMLEQVVVNLVVNARDAMPKGGTVTIATEPVVFSARDVSTNPARREGHFVRLTVSDTGVGMDGETLKRVFEPFFTTKESGKGSGLGLATVHGIVAQHKGWIELESRPGAGTTFRVHFPATAAPVDPAPNKEPAPTTPLPTGHETILIVEDNHELREIITVSLKGLGYTVHTAADAAEAMALCSTVGRQIDLLLTDMVLPGGINGTELAKHLQENIPALKIILTSGYSVEFIQAGIPDSIGLTYLPKPYTTRKLAETIRACLAY